MYVFDEWGRFIFVPAALRKNLETGTAWANGDCIRRSPGKGGVSGGGEK